MITVYCDDDITVKRIVYGTWGGVAAVTETEYKGRFEDKTKLVRNIRGEEVVSTARVILPLISIQHKDKIVYNGVEYSILTIETKKDFSNKYLIVSVA